MNTACPHCEFPNPYVPQLVGSEVKCLGCQEAFTMRSSGEGMNSPSESPASKDTKPQEGLPAAFLGCFGAVVGSFLPGFLFVVISAFMSGANSKLGIGGTIGVGVYVLIIFTVITVAAYLVGLLSLCFIARVRRPFHAFWLAALAGLLTIPAIALPSTQ